MVCPTCQAPLTFIALLTDQEPIIRILAYIGEPTSPPLIHPARGPRQCPIRQASSPARGFDPPQFDLPIRYEKDVLSRVTCRECRPADSRLELRTLTTGMLHGYGGTVIREQRKGLLDPGEGVLYPALRHMERVWWVRSEWGKTAPGWKARFYALTEKGQEVLKRKTEVWEGHVEAFAAILRHARG